MSETCQKISISFSDRSSRQFPKLSSSNLDQIFTRERPCCAFRKHSKYSWNILLVACTPSTPSARGWRSVPWSATWSRSGSCEVWEQFNLESIDVSWLLTQTLICSTKIVPHLGRSIFYYNVAIGFVRLWKCKIQTATLISTSEDLFCIFCTFSIRLVLILKANNKSTEIIENYSELFAVSAKLFEISLNRYQGF